MMRLLSAPFLMIALFTAGSAWAESPEPAADTAAPRAAEAAPATVTAERQVCRREKPTGSNRVVRVCRTVKQAEAEAKDAHATAEAAGR